MKEKDYSIEMMRSLACFFVVVIHVSSSYFLEWGQVSGKQWLYIDIFSSLARFSVPLFIMITGSLILKKECSIKKSIRRVARILFIILISSIFYLVVVSVILNNEKVNIKGWIVSILQSDVQGHLWYLYMLIGLYLISPIISSLINIGDIKLLKYYIILVLIYSVVILVPDTSEILLNRRILLCIPFEGFGSYIGCFIIGFYLYNIVRINKLGFKLSVLGIILINTITITVTYLFTKISGKPNQTFLDRNCINSILSASFLFYIITYLFNNYNISKNIKKVVSCIGRLSLIIYIIHPCIILVYTRYIKKMVTYFITNYYFNFIIELLIVFTVSLLVSYFASIFIKIIDKVKMVIIS